MTSGHDAAELRHLLAGLRAQACGMAHERLAADAPPSPIEEGGFARPPLCPAARRRENLACTHSLARTALRDALRFLAEREPAGGYAADLAFLAALDGGLGPLDHRRYDAETRLAQARAARDAAGAGEAQRSIDAATGAHDAAARALARLRARALAGLDAALSDAARIPDNRLAAAADKAPSPP